MDSYGGYNATETKNIHGLRAKEDLMKTATTTIIGERNKKFRDSNDKFEENMQESNRNISGEIFCENI